MNREIERVIDWARQPDSDEWLRLALFQLAATVQEEFLWPSPSRPWADARASQENGFAYIGQELCAWRKKGAPWPSENRVALTEPKQ